MSPPSLVGPSPLGSLLPLSLVQYNSCVSIERTMLCLYGAGALRAVVCVPGVSGWPSSILPSDKDQPSSANYPNLDPEGLFRMVLYLMSTTTPEMLPCLYTCSIYCQH
jgi:hypothetical protein